MKNKKLFKSIIPIILAVVIIMTAIPKAQATEEYLDFEKEIAAKARATEASEKLMEYFYQIGFCSDYPNYYSGSYRRQGDGSLVSSFLEK